MSEPTVEETIHLIEKIAACEGNAAKLILMRNFYSRGYAVGSADMRERIATFIEAGCWLGSEELLKLAAAIRSLPGSPKEE